MRLKSLALALLLAAAPAFAADIDGKWTGSIDTPGGAMTIKYDEVSARSAVYDFSDVASFGGTAVMFHDLAHPTVEGSNRMVAVMRPSLSQP